MCLKDPAPFPQPDGVHHLPSYSFQIHFNITLLSPHIDLIHGLFSSSSSTKTLEVFPYSSMRLTCSAHLTLLQLFILMIFARFSLSNFSHLFFLLFESKYSHQFVDFPITGYTKFHIHKIQQAIFRYLLDRPSLI